MNEERQRTIIKIIGLILVTIFIIFFKTGALEEEFGSMVNTILPTLILFTFLGAIYLVTKSLNREWLKKQRDLFLISQEFARAGFGIEINSLGELIVINRTLNPVKQEVASKLYYSLKREFPNICSRESMIETKFYSPSFSCSTGSINYISLS